MLIRCLLTAIYILAILNILTLLFISVHLHVVLREKVGKNDEMDKISSRPQTS